MAGSKSLYFDVVFASDIYVLGGTNAVLASYADYFFDIGVKVAVLPMHLPHATERQPVYTKIRERINSGKIFAIEDRTQTIDCSIFIVDNPSLLHTPDDLYLRARINAQQCFIVLPFPPEDGRGLTYNPLYVLNAAANLSRGSYTWAPVSPLVRKQFTKLYPYLPVTASDIRPILEPEQYRPRGRDWSSRRIVAGRHSRPHAEKWPKGRSNFMRIYPANEKVDIRFLGIRSDQLRLLTGKIPPNYRLYGYNEISVADFLHELDFFIYFNNPSWIEALGIVILEAMLAKVPCVLPVYMKENFGSHAIYANATNIWDIVHSRLQRRSELQTLVDGAHEFVSRNYSREAFAAWLAEIGFSPKKTNAVRETRADACYVVDLRRNSVFATLVLERIADAVEQGESCAIVVDGKSELSPYARAFIRERNIPLLDASPNSRILAAKLYLFDPFDPGAASVLQYIDAGEIEIHLSATPEFLAPEFFSFLTSYKKLKIRTANKSAKIWAESQTINCHLQDPQKPVLTSRSIGTYKNSVAGQSPYVGVFCEDAGEKIKKKLRRFSKRNRDNIIIYDSSDSEVLNLNIIRWVSKLSSIYVIALDEDMDITSRFAIMVAEGLGIPLRLLAMADQKGFGSIVRDAKVVVDGQE